MFQRQCHKSDFDSRYDPNGRMNERRLESSQGHLYIDSFKMIR